MGGKGLYRRLSITLLLQVGFITLATVLGVLTAKFVLEDVLIRQALVGEADYYWSQKRTVPGFPLPDTQNLTGYMGEVPPEIDGLETGFHNLLESREQLVLVSERQGQRLYLVYDGRRVNELAFIFGLVPLALVLLVLYLSSWLGFRASRRAISPIIALAKRVQNLDPEHPDPAAFDPAGLGSGVDDEVTVLAEAMQRFATRLNDFVVRETYFTRDASHELRSPLTVIRMASDLLADDPGLSDAGRKSLDRIKRSVRDMEELIGAFLLLARETESGLPSEEVCINKVAADELQRAAGMSARVTANLDEKCRLFVDTPERVVSVMIGNLVRNAFSYTDEGEVTVLIEPDQVVISDTGVGMSSEQVERVYEPFVRGGAPGGSRRGGYGVGLTIVKRLSDRFDWPVSIKSELGVGTSVTIAFPGARVEALEAGSAG
ncbi:MAG: HAMP domain-containing histidine kinase [Gammaproteobacteria bacterium]|nr:HAMP domain-containing histidine kinase [Gammaproteobacteria bacterium]